MRHKYPYIILIFVFLVSAYMVLFNNTEPPTTSSQPQNMLLTTTPAFADYTAAFLIVTNGTQRIFSAPTYHNLSSDVYIERTNPAIIHVKKEGILWKDFFSTLPMGLSATCLTTGTGQTFCSGNTTASNSGKLQFILNGTENAVALDQIIQPGDKLLITFGNSTNTQIQQQYNQIPNPIASPSAQVQTEE